MRFTRIKPYGDDTYTYWISGIYKVVSYRKGEYHAYFIQENFKNWGDYVAKPPPNRGITGDDCWSTLASAKESCKKHAAAYTPSTRIAKRAAEIKASLIEQAQEYAVSAA